MFEAGGETYCDHVSILQAMYGVLDRILPKVHVQIAMEDTVSLRRVKVPNKLTISQWSRRRHHLTHPSVSQSVTSLKANTTTPPTTTKERNNATHAVNPLRVKKRLVSMRTLIKPLPLHIQEITPLKRNGTNAANLISSDGACQGNLAGHGSAADDGVLEVEFLDHGGDAADIGVFVVGVAARVVVFIL
jgi:hypothetical protein